VLSRQTSVVGEGGEFLWDRWLQVELEAGGRWRWRLAVAWGCSNICWWIFALLSFVCVLVPLVFVNRKANRRWKNSGEEANFSHKSEKGSGVLFHTHQPAAAGFTDILSTTVDSRSRMVDVSSKTTS